MIDFPFNDLDRLEKEEDDLPSIPSFPSIFQPKMTIDVTREKMLDRIIEEQYDNMDYKTLWNFFEYHSQREFADWTTEEIEAEYKELFGNEE